jgi:hypothetical protein
MVEILKFREKAAAAQRRTQELRQAFLQFVTLDDELRFIVDPDYKAELAPYIAEIERLQDFHLAVKKAIQDSFFLYKKLREDANAKTDIEFTDHIQGMMGGVRSQQSGALNQLDRLKVLDAHTLETIILPENKPKADELKKLINVDIPAKIKALQEAQARIEKLFIDIPDITIGVDLPVV